MALPVSDSLSNINEQIEAAARVLGRSAQAHLVFDKIYFGKKEIKTVQDLAEMTGLNSKQILTQGKKLADNHIVEQVKTDNGVGYKKIPFFYQNKKKILRLAKNPAELAGYPTKRKTVDSQTISITINPNSAKIKHITIDDIESFSKVSDIQPIGIITDQVSEEQFKLGIQKILGESGEFKDWGGEKNDLFSTRINFSGSRRSVAFAFKGPGTKGKLTPGKLGTNGDQIQRLFEVSAELYIIQYWNQIEQSVLDQMEKLAIAKSVLNNQTVFFGIIDGIDSNRIYLAYRDLFE